MDHLRLTYQVLGKAGRGELLLDLHSQHWTALKVAQAIVKHEFPALAHLEMQGCRWTEESILYLFGIEGVSYSYESKKRLKSASRHTTK